MGGHFPRRPEDARPDRGADRDGKAEADAEDREQPAG
jgi:hypothetical protein